MMWNRSLALVSSPLWGKNLPPWGRNLPPISQESDRWLRTSSCLPPLWLHRGRRPCPLQMELVEIQCNDELNAKFYNSSPLPFFRDIALSSMNFPKYIAHVQRIVAIFGGTYCCEQLFPKNEVHEVSPSLPAVGPPSQWHSSVVELIHRAGHWNICSW